MKPSELIALLLAINNRWAFAALVVMIAVSLYLDCRDNGR
jgi:hypothetical protein